MHTTAFWVHLPVAFLDGLPLAPVEIQNGLVGIGNLLKTISALLLMCDVRDLAIAMTEHITSKPRTWEPNLFVYDRFPGGIGHSQPLFEMRDRFLRSALELLTSCTCESGCPQCVGPTGEVGETGKLHARVILEKIISQPTVES
jgi:DEAD/DEAH box helicase domain-containing protein